MRVRDRAQIPLQIFRADLGNTVFVEVGYSAVKHETV